MEIRRLILELVTFWGLNGALGSHWRPHTIIASHMLNKDLTLSSIWRCFRSLWELVGLIIEVGKAVVFLFGLEWEARWPASAGKAPSIEIYASNICFDCYCFILSSLLGTCGAILAASH